LESTLADLEIATFAVDEVVEGTQTGWSAGRLTVALPQLAVGAGEPALAEATVEVVRPGDAVRISNVLDVVLPCVKVDDPNSSFSGVLATPIARATGRSHRLGGVTVLSCCDWSLGGYVRPDQIPDSFVDMSGPGADRSPFGSTANLVLRFVPAPAAPVGEVDAAIRRETLRVARDLTVTTSNQVPSEIETYAWPPAAADVSLPGVAVILQVASEGQLGDTFWHGEPLRDLEPMALDPRDVLDGAITNGAYDWPAVRNVTAAYQDSALVRALFSAHGKRLRFVGVIMALGYLDTADQKHRSAVASATRASELGAEGAICTTFSSGNSHTDTMLTVRACEQRGIGTVALVCETNGGLTDHVPEADSLISTGNEDELVDPWIPDRIVGGEGPARSGEAVPTWAYLGSCSQMGETRWTMVAR
jgi:glycine reductase complex component B subunit alpha and beta